MGENKQIKYDIKQIDNQDVRIGKIGEQVVSVEIALTDEEHHNFLQNFSNKQTNWKNASYTKIFQNQLAGFMQKCHDKPGLVKNEKGEKNDMGLLVDKLREVSELYVELEKLINNRPKGMMVDPISILIQKLDALEKALTDPKTFPADPDAKIKYLGIQKKLTDELSEFKQNAINLQNKTNPPASEDDINRLFCIQPTDTDVPSLGKFVGSQIMHLAKFGQASTWKILEGSDSTKALVNFQQSFLMHDLLKYLSDAVAQVEVKAFALYGARYNNMREGIPDSMLQNMGKTPEKGGEKKWTNIKPYLNSVDSLREIQRVVNYAANTSTETPATQAPTTEKVAVDKQAATADQRTELEKLRDKRVQNARALAVILANVGELGVYLPIRASLSISAGLVHLAASGVVRAANYIAAPFATLGRMIYLKNNTNTWGDCFYEARDWSMTPSRKWNDLLTNVFERFDNGLSKLHQIASPVIKTKKWFNNHIEGVDKELKEKLNNPVSYFDVGLSFIKSSKVSGLMGNGFQSIANEFTGFMTTIREATTSRKTEEEIGQHYIDKMNDKDKGFVAQLSDQFNPKEKSAEASVNKESGVIDLDNFNALDNRDINEIEEASAATNIPETQTPNTNPANFKVREDEQQWRQNNISSPLDFVDDIVYGLAQFVIDPMFRKSPAAATIFFALANLSLGAMTMPALFSTGAKTALYFLPKILSKAMMGKDIATTGGFQVNNVLATFVEWKIPFFSYEALVELGHNPDFVDEFFCNSEKITTMVTVGVALGWAMHFLPVIPKVDISQLKVGNVGAGHAFEQLTGQSYTNLVNTNINAITGFVNLIVEESAQVTEYGSPPLTGIEYAFLALKSALLAENLLTGGNIQDPEWKKSIRKNLLPNGDNPKTKFDKLKAISADMKALLLDFNKKWAASGVGTIPTLSALVKEKGDEWVIENIIKPELVKNGCEARDIEDISKIIFDGMIAGFKEAPDFQQSMEKNKSDALKNAEPYIKRRKEEKELNARFQEAIKAESDIDVRDMYQKRAKMLELVTMVQKMELEGKKFTTTAHASAVYNELHRAFEAYNDAQKKLGNWDQLADGEQFLHSFHNKYIYKGKNNAMRILSLTLGVPFLIGLAWDAGKYYFGTPSMKYTARKRFASDAAATMQFFSFMARPGVVASRSYSYLFFGGTTVSLAAPALILNLIHAPIRGIANFIRRRRGQDEVNGPYVGTRIINGWINVIHKVCPAERWSRFTAGLLSAPFILAAPFEIPFRGKSTKPFFFQRVFKSLNADHGSAYYAKNVKIADTNETLKQDSIALQDQVNEHKAYDVSKYAQKQAPPKANAKTNAGVINTHRDVQDIVNLAYTDLKARSRKDETSGTKYQSFFRRIKFENKSKAEAATFTAYAKELRLLENRLNEVFQNLNNHDPNYAALREEFKALRDPIIMSINLPDQSKDLTRLAQRRNEIREQRQKLEELNNKIEALKKETANVASENDEKIVEENVVQDNIEKDDDEYSVVEQPKQQINVENNTALSDSTSVDNKNDVLSTVSSSDDELFDKSIKTTELRDLMEDEIIKAFNLYGGSNDGIANMVLADHLNELCKKYALKSFELYTQDKKPAKALSISQIDFQLAVDKVAGQMNPPIKITVANPNIDTSTMPSYDEALKERQQLVDKFRKVQWMNADTIHNRIRLSSNTDFGKLISKCDKDIDAAINRFKNSNEDNRETNLINDLIAIRSAYNQINGSIDSSVFRTRVMSSANRIGMNNDPAAKRLFDAKFGFNINQRIHSIDVVYTLEKSKTNVNNYKGDEINSNINSNKELYKINYAITNIINRYDELIKNESDSNKRDLRKYELNYLIQAVNYMQKDTTQADLGALNNINTKLEMVAIIRRLLAMELAKQDDPILKEFVTKFEREFTKIGIMDKLQRIYGEVKKQELPKDIPHNMDTTSESKQEKSSETHRRFTGKLSNKEERPVEIVMQTNPRLQSTSHSSHNNKN